LGIGNFDSQLEFVGVNFFKNLKISKLSSGAEHTIVQCGKLFFIFIVFRKWENLLLWFKLFG
jgi:hypothetical protein